MQVRIASGSTWPGARTLGGVLTLIALAVASAAFAQTPQQKAPSKPGPTAPATQQKPGEAPPAGGDPAAQQPPPLVFQPWAKYCAKGQESNGQQVCAIEKDGHFESGMLAVSAALVEPEGDGRKTLRLTLPLGMRLQAGTRMIIDQGQPLSASYVLCIINGCWSDYEASAELVGKMKKGQTMVVQAISTQGQLFSVSLPLADFAKAYDGPPTDPKASDDQQKKLQDDLQKRAEEARRKLEGQQPTAR
jgi:invasion protein IalB